MLNYATAQKSIIPVHIDDVNSKCRDYEVSPSPIYEASNTFGKLRMKKNLHSKDKYDSVVYD